MKIKVIGAGLAGCEAAAYLASHGAEVILYDIKPKAFTPAHSDKNFGELVCSNSLKSADVYGNACGLLKEEMRRFGSLTMRAAEETRVPAGGALAVDRAAFAHYITEKIKSDKNITVVCGEAESVPEEWSVVATGPLTTDALSKDIARVCGGRLHFFDASAPIVSRESIDFSACFYGDRYGRGGDDYINCPMNKEQYESFVKELVAAEKAVLHDFEKREIFEGCMPVEVMAARGADSLRFAKLKQILRRASIKEGKRRGRSLQPCGLPDKFKTGRAKAGVFNDSRAEKRRVFEIRRNAPQHVHKFAGVFKRGFFFKKQSRSFFCGADNRSRGIRRVGCKRTFGGNSPVT